MNEYLDQLSSLRTAAVVGLKAPHKAVLILSIIELIEYRVIDNNHIVLSESLERAFIRNWMRYVGDSILFKPIIGMPFWHLQSEPFWKLVSHSGTVVTKENMSGAKYSVGNLRKNVAHAEIDEELFELLQSEDVRTKVKALLITKYLSDAHLQKSEVIPILIIIGVSILPIAS